MEETLRELLARAEKAQELKDATERRVEMRAIYAAMIEYRLAALEGDRGIRYEGLEPLQRILGELNTSFTGASS